MRPASLRRFGIAAVAGGLLLASGAIPGYASNADKPEGTQPGRVAGGAERDGVFGSWFATLFVDGAQALERAVEHVVSWGNKAFVPAVGPRPVPAQVPVGIIVDDGAPF